MHKYIIVRTYMQGVNLLYMLAATNTAINITQLGTGNGDGGGDGGGFF